MASIEKYPLIAQLVTDIAITFCESFQFWNPNTEFEGPTVAVAVIGLQLGCRI